MAALVQDWVNYGFQCGGVVGDRGKAKKCDMQCYFDVANVASPVATFWCISLSKYNFSSLQQILVETIFGTSVHLFNIFVYNT
jgi:hypothetical protein